MTRRKAIAMVVGALWVLKMGWLGGVYLVQERWRQITVGRETTFVGGALRDDGTVDYVG